MNALEIFELVKKDTGAVVSFQEEGPTPSIYVRSDHILPVMRYLRETEELSFDNLMNQTAYHETEDPKLFWHLFFDVSQEDAEDHSHEELRLFWNIYSFAHHHRLTVESSIPIGRAEIDSVTSIWKSADWLERETYDLLGIRFLGHPDLRRIMLPDDWEGYPLRKDYVNPLSYQGVDNSPSEITKSFQPKGKKK
ncbi:MAG: NADH-quinone oxidoreductase subunit C [Proteobacteria bacterium]|nr:NADH-quinone oxidoreductase subunit C [Pseudomonadota bacterium]